MTNIKKLSSNLYKEISNVLLRKKTAAEKTQKLPSALHIETTGACMLKCEYCVLRERMPDKKVMSLSQFESLSHYFKDVKNISLSGLAEPLLNKNIVRFIKVIKKNAKHCNVSMFSNSFLLNEALSEELVDVKLNNYEFSLDGVIPEVVDKIRKGGNFLKTVENIRNLNNIKQKRNSKLPVLFATTVLQRQNYTQLPEIIRLASALGVERLNVNGLEPYTENMIENILWLPGYIPEDLPDILEKSIEVAEEEGISIGLASLVPVDPVCYEIERPVIMSNGDVSPCAVLAYGRDYFFKVNNENCHIKEQGTVKRKTFGNVFKTSLEEIWFGDEYSEFRVNVLEKKFPPECSSCMIKNQFICVRAKFSPMSVCQEVRALIKR